MKCAICEKELSTYREEEDAMCKACALQDYLDYQIKTHNTHVLAHRNHSPLTDYQKRILKLLIDNPEYTLKDTHKFNSFKSDMSHTIRKPVAKTWENGQVDTWTEAVRGMTEATMLAITRHLYMIKAAEGDDYRTLTYSYYQQAESE